MTVVEHLPGCNLDHRGGNSKWTCRRRVPVGEVATVTVEADGPCTHSGTMRVVVDVTAYTLDDVDQLDKVWAEVQQVTADQRDVMADWERRSLCQHPEDEECT